MNTNYKTQKWGKFCRSIGCQKWKAFGFRGLHPLTPGSAPRHCCRLALSWLPCTWVILIFIMFWRLYLWFKLTKLHVTNACMYHIYTDDLLSLQMQTSHLCDRDDLRPKPIAPSSPALDLSSPCDIRAGTMERSTLTTRRCSAPKSICRRQSAMISNHHSSSLHSLLALCTSDKHQQSIKWPHRSRTQHHSVLK